MTHDELLAELTDTEPVYARATLYSTLRAVVELHKPVQSYMFEEEACSHCSSKEDRLEILYPCQTIQAIEKEMG